MTRRQKLELSVFTIALVLLLALPLAAAYAQNDTGAVTTDQVNDVAARLYCPVCEHLPLDECMEPTCIQWREEIRTRLAQGQSEEQILDYFVGYYGDRVVGVPRDEGLQVLAYAGPLLVLAIGAGVSVTLFKRWRADGRAETSASHAEIEPIEENYRSRLESDLYQNH